MAEAKKKSPPSAPFIATITPVSIEKGNTKDGVRYTKMPKAKIRKGRTEMDRTVMAFGRANFNVFRMLREGKPVELACRWDGGTIRVLGKPELLKKAS